MRAPKVLLITGALVAVPMAAFALFTVMHWDPPEIRLNQLLRNQGAMSSEEALMAEFRIQAPSGSTIWLKDESIVVEIPGASGDWTTIRKGAPLTREPIVSITPSSLTPPVSRTRSATGSRTVIRTMWLILPAGVKTCRFTIVYQPETAQERGARLLLNSRTARRFPAISGWMVKHLSTTERWRTYRREVPVMASAMKLEAFNDAAAPAQ